jgi:N-alpha-acetyltransferase 35, NatC auxiliary subunit
MDSGALEEGEDLEDDFDVSQPLYSQQAIWIIDELICREVSWHQGYPLSQTLFTSIYLDKLLWPEPKALHEAHFLRSMDPDLSPSPVQDLLRAYCLGLVKCCDLVLSTVTSQHYYEVSTPRT